MNEYKVGFHISDNRGFHITFENGCTISVQFGWGNYCSNHGDLLAIDFTKRTEPQESPDAEVAAWNKEGAWITKEFKDMGDDVLGYLSPKEVLKFMNWVSKYKEKNDTKISDNS